MNIFFSLLGIFGVLITAIVLIIKAIRKRPKKITAIVLGGFFICLVIGFVLTPDNSFFIKNDVSGELPDIDTQMVDTLMTAGYTLEQASEIQKILNTVGIKSIEIESMTGKATEGLNAVVCYPNGLTDRNRRFHFTTDNGVLFYAGFLNEDLYDCEKGGYLKSYGDVHVPETKVDMSTYSKLQMLATETVKSYLKYPSSSVFDAFAWGVGRSDDKYKIQGKVSAKNAFGVKDDLFFSVYFVQKDNDFLIEGVVIDGKRVK